ncbi:MAG: glycosyltransferase family 39 protein, partial [Candidatus Omnitrophica bacterium]|nr:glycosyltransferase family 39 protein [Candidatus Omnitrophota bacterium]
MSNSLERDKRFFSVLLVLLLAYAAAVALTLTGKYPWHDEITTLRDSRQSFSHLVQTYYTHKGYILAAKISTSIFGESWTALRLPSIVMGGLTIAAVYWLGTLLYRRSVGIVAAAYLLLHPNFLFHSTDARGYQGACLFSILAAGFIWRGLSEVKVLDCVLAAICLFLGLMMQPAGALTYPGMAVVAVILIAQSFRSRREEERTKKTKLIWLLTISFIVALVLIGPRIRAYLSWDTLLIPSRFASEAGAGETPSGGPLRSLEGWRIQFAPLISAELHTGGIVSFGWFLILAALISSWREKRLQTLLLFLSVMTPFAFFFFYNPPFLVHRYLYCTTPFAILLVVYGAFSIGEWIGQFFRAPKRRWIRRGAEGLLIASLVFSCWGPFRAEVAYSEYGSTWMVPVAELAEADFMQETRLVLVDEKPLWRDQLEMLGVPEDRLDYYQPSKEGGYEPLLNRLDSNTWVVLKAYSQDPELQGALRKQGCIELRIEQGLFYLPPSDLDGDSQSSRFLMAVEYLDQNFRLDFRFEYSVAQVLKAHGKEDLAKPYEARAMEGMAEINRWDYPRTFGA